MPSLNQISPLKGHLSSVRDSMSQLFTLFFNETLKGHPLLYFSLSANGNLGFFFSLGSAFFFCSSALAIGEIGTLLILLLFSKKGK